MYSVFIYSRKWTVTRKRMRTLKVKIGFFFVYALSLADTHDNWFLEIKFVLNLKIKSLFLCYLNELLA